MGFDKKKRKYALFKTVSTMDLLAKPHRELKIIFLAQPSTKATFILQIPVRPHQHSEPTSLPQSSSTTRWG
jgi:hypothetical protein